eukprot:g25880.t1
MLYGKCHAALQLSIALLTVAHVAAKECSTEGLNGTNLTCIFPFTVDGITFEECTEYGGYSPWCALETDETGTFIDGMHWMFCPDLCLSITTTKEPTTEKPTTTEAAFTCDAPAWNKQFKDPGSICADRAEGATCVPKCGKQYNMSLARPITCTRDGWTAFKGCDQTPTPSEPGQGPCGELKKCDDGDNCTDSYCQHNTTCVHLPKSGCYKCETVEECPAGGDCRNVKCTTNPKHFAASATLYCMYEYMHCWDGDDCTADFCIQSKCHHQRFRTPKGIMDEFDAAPLCTFNTIADIATIQLHLSQPAELGANALEAALSVEQQLQSCTGFGGREGNVQSKLAIFNYTEHVQQPISEFSGIMSTPLKSLDVDFATATALIVQGPNEQIGQNAETLLMLLNGGFCDAGLTSSVKRVDTWKNCIAGYGEGVGGVYVSHCMEGDALGPVQVGPDASRSLQKEALALVNKNKKVLAIVLSLLGPLCLFSIVYTLHHKAKQANKRSQVLPHAADTRRSSIAELLKWGDAHHHRTSSKASFADRGRSATMPVLPDRARKASVVHIPSKASGAQTTAQGWWGSPYFKQAGAGKRVRQEDRQGLQPLDGHETSDKDCPSPPTGVLPYLRWRAGQAADELAYGWWYVRDACSDCWQRVKGQSAQHNILEEQGDLEAGGSTGDLGAGGDGLSHWKARKAERLRRASQLNTSYSHSGHAQNVVGAIASAPGSPQDQLNTALSQRANSLSSKLFLEEDEMEDPQGRDSREAELVQVVLPPDEIPGGPTKFHLMVDADMSEQDFLLACCEKIDSMQATYVVSAASRVGEYSLRDENGKRLPQQESFHFQLRLLRLNGEMESRARLQLVRSTVAFLAAPAPLAAPSHPMLVEVALPKREIPGGPTKVTIALNGSATSRREFLAACLSRIDSMQPNGNRPEDGVSSAMSRIGEYSLEDTLGNVLNCAAPTTLTEAGPEWAGADKEEKSSLYEMMVQRQQDEHARVQAVLVRANWNPPEERPMLGVAFSPEPVLVTVTLPPGELPNGEAALTLQCKQNTTLKEFVKRICEKVDKLRAAEHGRVPMLARAHQFDLVDTLMELPFEEHSRVGNFHAQLCSLKLGEHAKVQAKLIYSMSVFFPQGKEPRRASVKDGKRSSVTDSSSSQPTNRRPSTHHSAASANSPDQAIDSDGGSVALSAEARAAGSVGRERPAEGKEEQRPTSGKKKKRGGGQGPAVGAVAAGGKKRKRGNSEAVARVVAPASDQSLLSDCSRPSGYQIQKPGDIDHGQAEAEAALPSDGAIMASTANMPSEMLLPAVVATASVEQKQRQQEQGTVAGQKQGGDQDQAMARDVAVSSAEAVARGEKEREAGADRQEQRAASAKKGRKTRAASHDGAVVTADHGAMAPDEASAASPALASWQDTADTSSASAATSSSTISLTTTTSTALTPSTTDTAQEAMSTFAASAITADHGHDSVGPSAPASAEHASSSFASSTTTTTTTTTPTDTTATFSSSSSSLLPPVPAAAAAMDPASSQALVSAKNMLAERASAKDDVRQANKDSAETWWKGMQQWFQVSTETSPANHVDSGSQSAQAAASATSSAQAVAASAIATASTHTATTTAAMPTHVTFTSSSPPPPSSSSLPTSPITAAEAVEEGTWIGRTSRRWRQWSKRALGNTAETTPVVKDASHASQTTVPALPLASSNEGAASHLALEAGAHEPAGPPSTSAGDKKTKKKKKKKQQQQGEGKHEKPVEPLGPERADQDLPAGADQGLPAGASAVQQAAEQTVQQAAENTVHQSAQQTGQGKQEDKQETTRSLDSPHEGDAAARSEHGKEGMVVSANIPHTPVTLAGSTAAALPSRDQPSHGDIHADTSSTPHRTSLQPTNPSRSRSNVKTSPSPARPTPKSAPRSSPKKSPAQNVTPSNQKTPEPNIPIQTGSSKKEQVSSSAQTASPSQPRHGVASTNTSADPHHTTPKPSSGPARAEPSTPISLPSHKLATTITTTTTNNNNNNDNTGAAHQTVILRAGPALTRPAPRRPGSRPAEATDADAVDTSTSASIESPPDNSTNAAATTNTTTSTCIDSAAQSPLLLPAPTSTSSAPAAPATSTTTQPQASDSASSQTVPDSNIDNSTEEETQQKKGRRRSLKKPPAPTQCMLEVELPSGELPGTGGMKVTLMVKDNTTLDDVLLKCCEKVDAMQPHGVVLAAKKRVQQYSLQDHSGLAFLPQHPEQGSFFTQLLMAKKSATGKVEALLVRSAPQRNASSATSTPPQAVGGKKKKKKGKKKSSTKKKKKQQQEGEAGGEERGQGEGEKGEGQPGKAGWAMALAPDPADLEDLSGRSEQDVQDEDDGKQPAKKHDSEKEGGTEKAEGEWVLELDEEEAKQVPQPSLVPLAPVLALPSANATRTGRRASEPAPNEQHVEAQLQPTRARPHTTVPVAPPPPATVNHGAEGDRRHRRTTTMPAPRPRRSHPDGPRRPASMDLLHELQQRSKELKSHRERVINPAPDGQSDVLTQALSRFRKYVETDDLENSMDGSTRFGNTDWDV